MNMTLPSAVLHAITCLNAAGYEAYAVGGCVRDTLMGRAPNDWDITTSALPEQTIDVFDGYRTLDVGLKHGTLTVFIEEQPIEITTYRVDGPYTDGRHPDSVVFTPSLENDLRRRDFTINAMAYHPNVGLVDPFDGRQDCSEGVIRCVGNPHLRFNEDALRIIRGLRFASDFGFVIEPNTAQAMHALASNLQKVAMERISTEFTKLLCGQHVTTVLREYADILELLFPSPLNFEGVSQSLQKIPTNPLSRYAALLFSCAPEEVAIIGKHLRLSNHITKEVITLVQNRDIPLAVDRPNVLRVLNRLGPQNAFLLTTLRSVRDEQDYSQFVEQVNQAVEQKACYRMADLAVNGDDLRSVGISPGPMIGTILNALLDAVMDGILPNTHDELLTYAKMMQKEPMP